MKKIELLWYNPSEKEYQLGDKRKYIELLNNSNEPHEFFLIEKFCNLTDRVKVKLISRIKKLNSYRKTTQLAYSYS